MDFLHTKINEIKILISRYNIREKTSKINEIITNEYKKNSHKVIKVGSEAPKIAGNYFFEKKIFRGTLRKNQNGMKEFKNNLLINIIMDNKLFNNFNFIK